MEYTRFLADTRRPGTCRYCGMTVEYARRPGGDESSLHPPGHLLPQQRDLWTGEAATIAVAVSPRHLTVCEVWQRRRKKRGVFGHGSGGFARRKERGVLCSDICVRD